MSAEGRTAALSGAATPQFAVGLTTAYTGSDYALKSAAQMVAIKAMVDRLARHR